MNEHQVKSFASSYGATTNDREPGNEPTKEQQLSVLRELYRGTDNPQKQAKLRTQIQKLEDEIKDDETDDGEPKPEREDERKAREKQKRFNEASARSMAELKKMTQSHARSHRGEIALMLDHLGTDPARSYASHAQSSDPDLDLECLASLGEEVLQRAGLLPPSSPLQPLGDGRLGAGPMTPTQAVEVQKAIANRFGGTVR